MAYRFFRLLLLLASAYVAACLVLFAMQRSMIYHPGENRDPRITVSGAQQRKVRTADGEVLQTWWVGGRGDRPVVAFFHGNAGTVEDRDELLEMFAGLGFGLVAPEYRGYGGSTGSASYRDLVADALLVTDDVLKEREFYGRPVILYGESLGTGIATAVAAERRVDGLILQSPYTSVSAAASERFPWLPVNLLLTERYENIDSIARVSSPLLIVHGAEDELFPLRMAEEVYRAARGERSLEVLDGVGHNDIYPSRIADVVGSFGMAVIAKGSPVREAR